MRILLGMSGGVDSTYAALKLKNEGHEVEGAVLVMHRYSPTKDAEEAAAALGIALHVIDCTADFERCVVGNFISEYRAARTPNPCVICNSEIKFVKLLDYARDNGFDAIATGHYAKINAIDGEGNIIPKTLEFINNNMHNSLLDEYRYAVSYSNDGKKDQTYMLWRLPQSVLRYLVFPLADECKANVKNVAEEAGLISPERKESQEICFIPDGDYAAYIEERTGVSPEGDFIDAEGNVLGRHKGIIRYTKGQRRGLGISSASRIFVTDIDPEKNTVTLSASDSYATRVRVTDTVFSGLSPDDVKARKRLSVKLRYASPRVPCCVEIGEDGAVIARLEEPARAVTDGQSAVFYDGDLVAFGGFISGSE